MRVHKSGTTTQRLVAFALAAGVLTEVTLPGSARSDIRPDAIAGAATVIDGDTLAINGIRIRLEGIDAPEAGQTCNRPLLGAWACGAQATAALTNLVAGKQLKCEPRGLDKYGRTLGVCFIGSQDINGWMVRQGHAWAFTKYSTSYVKEEAEAKTERRGIWQGESTPAWDYRAERWARAEPKAPQGCAIKGNVTAHGKIYHMPWSPWYAQINMDPNKGRRWFCTEAEAVAAGWRPVNMH